MFDILAKGFIAVADVFQKNDDDLVRLFATEYNREYRHLMKQGVFINGEFVRKFLDNANNEVDKITRRS